MKTTSILQGLLLAGILCCGGLLGFLVCQDVFARPPLEAAATTVDPLPLPQKTTAAPAANAQKTAAPSRPAATTEPGNGAVKTAPAANLSTTLHVVNCKKSITLRAKPSADSQELAQIPLGSVVTFLENAGNGFYKINYDGRIGYSLAAYLAAKK
ncbi:SH3 domain-containing protein [uncultured Selenomonas sp.]|uniref:SH3 domain-containing protein n=1 Tax=uncultured Selenomonas sp. TaxID=159275 RepID=UPI0025DE834A|nr:SH3 domain-containing protein [uncultured Selenomonas sp.]